MSVENGYTQFENKDCKIGIEPTGTHQPTTIVLSQHAVDTVKWNWCHVVTSVFGYFFCQPFGLISLVMAMLAYSDHKARDYDGSQRKRKVALGFGIASIVIGSILFILFVISLIIAASAYQSNEYEGYRYGHRGWREY